METAINEKSLNLPWNYKKDGDRVGQRVFFNK